MKSGVEKKIKQERKKSMKDRKIKTTLKIKTN